MQCCVCIFSYFSTSLDTKPMSLDTKPMSRGARGITAVARCVWVWLDIKNGGMLCCIVYVHFSLFQYFLGEQAMPRGVWGKNCCC